MKSNIYSKIDNNWARSNKNVTYANNKGADQPAHPRSLISTFVVVVVYLVMALDAANRRLVLSLLLYYILDVLFLSLLYVRMTKPTK